MLSYTTTSIRTAWQMGKHKPGRSLMSYESERRQH